MISLSTRAKEAIKTALAMVLAYGIALNLGWLNPYWAGFAVAMISLPTAGQSLNKGALRMFGTLLGGLAALTLFSLFPQQRWMFMAALSVYIAVCTYMLTGQKHQYFWTVAGFVCLVIALSGPQPETAFEHTMARVQETALGIGVYTLISVFLWPQSSAPELKRVSTELIHKLGALYGDYRDAAQGRAVDSGIRQAGQVAPATSAEVIQLLAALRTALDAAASERYEIRVDKHRWEQLSALTTGIAETLEQWREGFAEIRSIDIEKVLPDLPSFHAELDRRGAQMARMLSGEAPEHAPATVELHIDRAGARALPHFERAALAVMKDQFERLDASTRALFECVEDLAGFALHPPPQRARRRQPFTLPTPDPDRLLGVVMVQGTLWISFLLWIYVDPPGHAAWLQLPATIAFTIAQSPYIRPWTLVLAFFFGVPLAGILYVFVMPQLSGYAELGTMLFCAYFLVSYVFWKPQQAFTKLACNVSLISLMPIENQQTYDFAQYANSAAFTVMAIVLLVGTAYIPVSPRAEKAFVRLLRRYFRSAEFLLSTMATDDAGRTIKRSPARIAYHRAQIAKLPRLLGIWAGSIDYRVLRGARPEQVGAIVTNVQALTHRLDQLLGARSVNYADLLVRELLADIRSWRGAVQSALRDYADHPGGVDVEQARERVRKRLARLEARTEEIFNLEASQELSEEQRVSFYQMLGGYRGLTAAGLAYAEAAEQLDWSQWREPKF